MHGQIQVEGGTEGHLAINTDVTPRGGRRVRLVVAADAAERIRDHRDVRTRGRRRFVPQQDAGQGERRSREVARDGSPRRLLPGLQIETAEVDTPSLDALLV